MGNSESNRAGSIPAGNYNNDAAVNAISVQKQAVGDLDKKIQQLQLRIAQERKLALECVKSDPNKMANRDRAKRHLMKAKRLQVTVSKFEGMQINLEILQDSIESATITKRAFNTLAEGNDELKRMTKTLDPDTIANLTDELVEGAETLVEVQNLISQPIVEYPSIDETDLDVELAALQLEVDTDENATSIVSVKKSKKPPAKIPITLPSAPTTKVVMIEEEPADEDDEAAQLKFLMQDMN